MVALPPMSLPDPTLEAADRAMEAAAQSAPRRKYLGMSAIGHPCSRKLWYDLNASGQARPHSAETLKRFEDGHASEAIMIRRLKAVPGITLHDINPHTGEQWGFEDLGGRFRGHMDGAVLGLLQAPKTWHVFEHKCVSDKKQAEIVKLKAKHGEKAALKEWDQTYYAQAVLYMHYSGMDRHYLTVATPGTRTVVSCRTERDPIAAVALIDKAERILNARAPLAKISEDRNWYQCKWCDHTETCHGA
jgi:hypothetical protein